MRFLIILLAPLAWLLGWIESLAFGSTSIWGFGVFVALAIALAAIPKPGVRRG